MDVVDKLGENITLNLDEGEKGAADEDVVMEEQFSGFNKLTLSTPVNFDLDEMERIVNEEYSGDTSICNIGMESDDSYDTGENDEDLNEPSVIRDAGFALEESHLINRRTTTIGGKRWRRSKEKARVRRSFGELQLAALGSPLLDFALALPRRAGGLKRLVKFDPMVVYSVEESEANGAADGAARLRLRRIRGRRELNMTVAPGFDLDPEVMEPVKPIKIDRTSKRKRTATDSAKATLVEDAPELLRFLLERGVPDEEMKLYGGIGSDEPIDQSFSEDWFEDLEVVVS
ncbi:hypothetical protein Droror1_Dr00026636 [Drosera rotundifolia]